MRPIQLETTRMILKTITPASADSILNFYHNNREFLEPVEAERSPNFYTRKYMKQLLKWDNNCLYSGTAVRFWLFLKNTTEEPIGTISLTNIQRGVYQSCQIGYKLDRSFQKKGYMSEALIKIMEYAFYPLKLHRLEAYIMPENQASIALVERLGFEKEGLCKSFLKINGKWEDHLQYAFVNEDSPSTCYSHDL